MKNKIKTFGGDVSWSKTNLKSERKCHKNAELITFLLSSILTKEQLPVVVEKLLNEFNNLSDLLHAEKDKLLSVQGINEPIYHTFAVIRELLTRSLNEPIIKKNIINCRVELLNYLKFTMGSLKIEHFRVLFLNSKNVLLVDELLGSGTINHTPVYAREIIKRILFHEASSIVLIHNHPSGDPKPSINDIRLTAKIINACKTIDVKVLDHLIIGTNGYFSFDEAFASKGDLSLTNFDIDDSNLTEKI